MNKNQKQQRFVEIAIALNTRMLFQYETVTDIAQSLEYCDLLSKAFHTDKQGALATYIC